MSIQEFEPPRQGRGLKKVVTIRDFMSQYKSIQEWLDGIRSGKAAENTRDLFSRCLFYYSRMVNLDPDQLLQQREAEFLSQEKAIRFRAEDTFRAALSSYKGKDSVKAQLSAAVRSFYDYYRMPLNEKGFNYKADEFTDYLPSTEEILKLFLAVPNHGQSTTLRDQCLVLFLAETGLRPQTIVSLRYKHVRAEFETGKVPCAINVPSGITKSHISSVSFILEDAFQALKQYLDERMRKGERIADESLLFPSLHKAGEKLDPAFISTLFKELGEMVGLPVERTAQRRFRAYNLRKRFQTVCEGSGIPLNWVDLLMNHQPRGSDASAYSRPSLEQLRGSYLKASRELLILPQYIKSLAENPSMTMTYESLKLALKLLPLGTKTLEITKQVREIDESNLSLAAKYDQLYKLTDSTIKTFRNGGEEYTQDILPLDEAKALVKDGEAQILQVLPDGSILVKRRKRSEPDEEQALTILRASEDSKGIFGLQEALQARFNA